MLCLGDCPKTIKSLPINMRTTYRCHVANMTFNRIGGGGGCKAPLSWLTCSKLKVDKKRCNNFEVAVCTRR